MIVGLCSSYKEGPLVQGAVRSLLAACDRVVVFEGPAGEPLEDDVPASDFTPWFTAIRLGGHPLVPLTVREGEWRTDAAKRSAMIESLRPYPKDASTWGVWVDGDEVLCNAEYLRDWINLHNWREQEGMITTEVGDPDVNLGWPVKLVEMDGGVHIVQAKILRLDRLDGYSVSSSVFKTTLGQLHGRGNYPLRVGDSPLARQLRQLSSKDAEVFAWPPMPCEPFIMHRSLLRHPRRAGLRMSDQEKVEIEKAQAAGVGL